MNKLVKHITNDQIYTEFAYIVKSILRITERETQLLAELLRFDSAKDRGHNVICTANRREIIKNTGIYKDNVCRIISRFKKMGILIPGPAEDEWHVWEALIPITIKDRVQLSIILRLLKTNKEDKRSG